jgi:hypothetical protein
MKSPYLDKTFVVVAKTKQELYTFSSIFLSDVWPNLAHPLVDHPSRQV